MTRSISFPTIAKRLRGAAVTVLAASAAACVLAGPASAATSGDFTYTDDGTAVTITGCSADPCAASLAIPSSIGGHPVTKIGVSAFDNKASLVSVTIPDSVVTIGSQSFAHNSGLTSVTFQGVSKVTTIEGFAFYQAVNLESVTLPASLVTVGDNAFQGLLKLTTLTIPANVTTIGNSAFQTLPLLNRVAFASGSKLKTIGNSAFKEAESLTSISLPGTLKSIGPFAFYSDTNLSRVFFAGNAPTVGQEAFLNLPDPALAVVAASLKGYGHASSVFHGLIVSNPVSKLGVETGTVKVTRSLITWTTRLLLPGEGQVTLRATTKSGRRVLTHCLIEGTPPVAGAYTVTCKIGKAGRKALRRAALNLTITANFTPTGGRKATKVQTLKIKRTR